MPYKLTITSSSPKSTQAVTQSTQFQTRKMHGITARSATSLRRFLPWPDHPQLGPGPLGTTKIYKVGPLWAPKFLAHCATFLSKEGNSKNRTKIRSILQIYVWGDGSRFHASGPEGPRSGPASCHVRAADPSCRRNKVSIGYVWNAEDRKGKHHCFWVDCLVLVSSM